MAFNPRMTANGIYNDSKWYASNPFYQSGYGLPNCTCYAWGRFWEVRGERANLPTGNAGTWVANVQGFKVQQIPVLGAIACWGASGYSGHVAVVEQIDGTGNIITSNSGYYRPIASYPPSTHNYFWTETCSKSNGYRSSWMVNRGYSLRGFIVPDKYADGEPVSPETPQHYWQSITQYQSNYLNSKSINNAYCVADVLLPLGWSVNAVAGLLGNALHESFISADMEEIGVTHGGYGLIQWTGGRRTKLEAYLTQNYPNWRSNLNDNGNGQSMYLDVENNTEYVWIVTPSYNISFNDFKVSTLSPSWLASAYLYNMERPADPSASESSRQYHAEYFYNMLQGYRPSQPTSRVHGKMPLWMKIRYHL